MICLDKKTFRRILTLIKIKDIYWAKLINDSNVDLNKIHYDKKSGNLYLDDFNIIISKDIHNFFLKGYHYAKLLGDVVGAVFNIDESNNIIIELNGIKVNIQTSEELFILNEIFVEGVYNIISVKENPMIIWDIGMNVGTSSLYFAAKYDNSLVISYEPFTQTYKQAIINLSLNPHLSNQIKAQNAGIGLSNKRLSVEYCNEYKGSNGIFGVPKRLINQNIEIAKEKISIKDASEVLESIISEYPNREIIAKIDCEGSEYEILENLFKSGKLLNISVIMMEWHYKGPQKIEELLNKSGFTFFSFKPCSLGTGMIYAVQKNPICRTV